MTNDTTTAVRGDGEAMKRSDEMTLEPDQLLDCVEISAIQEVLDVSLSENRPNVLLHVKEVQGLLRDRVKQAASIQRLTGENAMLRQVAEAWRATAYSAVSGPHVNAIPIRIEDVDVGLAHYAALTCDEEETT